MEHNTVSRDQWPALRIALLAKEGVQQIIRPSEHAEAQ
jgi:hypothetical protein